MGQFTFMVKESCWRDVFSYYDDEEVLQLAREKFNEGCDKDDVENFIRDYLREQCWDNVNYGEAYGVETDDIDYDIDTGDSLSNTVKEIVNKAEEELTGQDLGSIDDDNDTV